MSEATLPISPARFAAAIRDLPLSSLHLKAAELRNSIAHLDYSNEELRPFAYPSSPAEPDPDCVDAIKENEVVIQRMKERIGLLKAEAERRGVSWREFMGSEELAQEGQGEVITNGTGHGTETAANGVAGDGHDTVMEETDGAGDNRHSAWTDGTFQVGRISSGGIVMDGVSVQPGNSQGQGQGGRLSDEELRRRMEERMRVDAEEDDDEGMHL